MRYDFYHDYVTCTEGNPPHVKVVRRYKNDDEHTVAVFYYDDIGNNTQHWAENTAERLATELNAERSGSDWPDWPD